MIKRGLLGTLTLCLIVSNVNSQNLRKINLSKKEKEIGISFQYECKTCFEESIVLTLYKNRHYKYYVKQGEYEGLSEGKWAKKKNYIFLTSTLTKSDIPIKLTYSDTITKNNIIKNIPFAIPVNLKGILLSDSRIFINNNYTYCFPFLDTCIGNYKTMDSIKIDFGNDFKSKWIVLKEKAVSTLLITVQTDVLLSNYLVFKKRRYSIVDTSLLLNE